MQYTTVVSAIFLERPNRFIAIVKIDGNLEQVHVKNTGRCQELLILGCCVYLALAAHSKRKTRYDLIAVKKERPHQPPLLINMDAQCPNVAMRAWLQKRKSFSNWSRNSTGGSISKLTF